jgi:hypothetical protein
MTKKKSRALVGGRPTVFTDQVLQKLEEAFSIDATVREACAYAGISESVYYLECNRNPQFVERMERSMQFAFMLAKKVVVQAMKENDGNLAMKWLKNRQRDRYHEQIDEVVKEAPVEELIKEVEQGTKYSEQFQTQ